MIATIALLTVAAVIVVYAASLWLDAAAPNDGG
jgi:hypothetical protein